MLFTDKAPTGHKARFRTFDGHLCNLGLFVGILLVCFYYDCAVDLPAIVQAQWTRLIVLHAFLSSCRLIMFPVRRPRPQMANMPVCQLGQTAIFRLTSRFLFVGVKKYLDFCNL
jgi:hypothetical protein